MILAQEVAWRLTNDGLIDRIRGRQSDADISLCEREIHSCSLDQPVRSRARMPDRKGKLMPLSV